jgi:tripeptidyl-peptidase-1
MRLLSLSVVLAGAAIVHSAAVPSTHVVHEKRDVSTKKWVKREKLSSRAILPMRIGLKQRNLHRADDFLMDV